MSGVSHIMPTSFLTRDQRNTFGRFRGPPAPEDLARYFHLDGADHATVSQMRGRTNRLGFAILLCGVRFTGRFIAQSSDVPDEVIVYIADQLDKMVPGRGAQRVATGSGRTARRGGARPQRCHSLECRLHAGRNRKAECRWKTHRPPQMSRGCLPFCGGISTSSGSMISP